MAKILAEYYIYGEDEFGNFTGNFKVGDCVMIRTYDKKFKCSILDISAETMLVEDEDYKRFVINILEILEIHDLFC